MSLKLVIFFNGTLIQLFQAVILVKPMKNKIPACNSSDTRRLKLLLPQKERHFNLIISETVTFPSNITALLIANPLEKHLYLRKKHGKYLILRSW